MSVGIDVEHSIAHTHTQNGLAESFIKRLQLISRPLFIKTKLFYFFSTIKLLRLAQELKS